MNSAQLCVAASRIAGSLWDSIDCDGASLVDRIRACADFPAAGTDGDLTEADRAALRTLADENEFAEYSAPISTDPSSYGDCTDEDAARIAASLAAMIEREFPGISVPIEYAQGSSTGISGPDSKVIEEIGLWIEENWTAAL